LGVAQLRFGLFRRVNTCLPTSFNAGTKEKKVFSSFGECCFLLPLEFTSTSRLLQSGLRR
jgi:hypothetical protein